MKDSINNDIDAIFNIFNEKIKEQIIENKKNKKLVNYTEESSFDKILDIDISNIYKELYDECDVDAKNGNKLYELGIMEDMGTYMKKVKVLSYKKQMALDL